MTIAEETYENMSLNFYREVRTRSSEEYIITSSDPDSGQPYVKGGYALGKAIIQFTDTTLSQRNIFLHLILDSDWTEEAIDQLIEDIDYQIIDSFGAGFGSERTSFYVQAIIKAEYVGDLQYGFEKGIEQSIYEARNRIEQTQKSVETLPLALSETVRAAIDEQYQDIEDIIESDIESAEKKERISEKIKYGLERGMPTLIIDREREIEK